MRIYNIIVAVVLFVKVLFANFAESVAEGRRKAQAATLKRARMICKPIFLWITEKQKTVSYGELKKGDIVLVKAGAIIPGGGEVIEGIASVDKSAITGGIIVV